MTVVSARLATHVLIAPAAQQAFAKVHHTRVQMGLASLIASAMEWAAVPSLFLGMIPSAGLGLTRASLRCVVRDTLDLALDP